MPELVVNGRNYALPSTPVVGICLDGTSWDYLFAALQHMPHLSRILSEGASGTAQSVTPSFTNPNNMAIATGVPPSVNGISGNYYFDPEKEEEVMMNEPEFLLAPTLFAQVADQGKSVAVVTVKDKLRRLLGKDLNGICFSGEKANETSLAAHGIDCASETLMGRPQPGIYDPELSVYCLEAGVKLLETRPLDLLYLTTTDFVQHKYAPGAPEAIGFMAALDQQIGVLDRLGAVIGITADHGMNDKVNEDGSPRVIYMESLLEALGIPCRVILPITDPYVVHHGSLGSFGMAYLKHPDQWEDALVALNAAPGVEDILTREEAAAAFDLPLNKLGDLVVLGDQYTAIGKRPESHDLTVVAQGLRSHGGLHETDVPLIFNRKLTASYALRLASGRARNYDLFDFLLNGISG